MVAVALNSISYILRSLRWGVLLRAERSISPVTVFWATMLGYLANSFLPARAGEVIRSAVLGQKAGLSKSWVFATALTERLLDAIALILISLGGLLVMDRLMAVASGATVQHTWFVRAWLVLGALALVGIVAAFGLPKLERPLRRLLGRLPLSSKLRGKLLGMLTSFLLGLRAFQQWARAAKFTGLTLTIWLANGLGSVFCARALGLPLDLPVALVFLAALGIASAVPSTPGYVGVSQFVGVTVLMPFGFDRSPALAFVLVAQGLNYLIVTTFGLLGLWRLRLSWPYKLGQDVDSEEVGQLADRQ